MFHFNSGLEEMEGIHLLLVECSLAVGKVSRAHSIKTICDIIRLNNICTEIALRIYHVLIKIGIQKQLEIQTISSTKSWEIVKKIKSVKRFILNPPVCNFHNKLVQVNFNYTAENRLNTSHLQILQTSQKCIKISKIRKLK